MAKPIKTLKSGKIQIACWENDYQGNKSYTYTLQKNYKTKEGEWKQTTSFGISDLKDIQDGITFIRMKGIENKNSQAPDGFEQVVNQESQKEKEEREKLNVGDVPF